MLPPFKARVSISSVCSLPGVKLEKAPMLTMHYRMDFIKEIRWQYLSRSSIMGYCVVCSVYANQAGRHFVKRLRCTSVQVS